MKPGAQCVMTPGTTLMLLWSANSWDMHTLEVSILIYFSKYSHTTAVLYYHSKNCGVKFTPNVE